MTTISPLAKFLPLEQACSQAQADLEQIVEYLDFKMATGMAHGELERELEKKERERKWLFI